MLKILLLFIFISPLSLKAEIIENKRILNKNFDIWNVSCEDDEMFSNIRCRLFVEITDGTTLFVNPNSNGNKILLVSKDAYSGRKFFIKIDNNKLINSDIFINNSYSLVNFKSSDIESMYNQLQNGNYFYTRFTIKDSLSVNGFKEITAKFSLAEFEKALIYFDKQVNKYNFNINK